MTAAVGAAAVAMGAFSAAMAVGVKQASDLQQAVANVKSIKPEIDTSKVFSSLNLMQTRVAQSSKDMAASLYNIFSSMDIGAEDGLRLVEKFARGATAAMTDANTFGTAIVGVLNAYKLSVADADHVSDVFFNTVKRGVVTGQELAANLGLVTQSAKAAGLGVDQLGAFIAAVTKEGGSAATNINNLNNLLLKINTKEAAQGFKDIGIQVFDSTGKMRPMLDILTDLRGRLVGYTEKAAAAALQNIFPDLQARAGALTIMNQLDTVRKGLEENAQATGSTASAYETMVNTFENQSKILGQSVQSVLMSGGNALLPALNAAVVGVQGFVKDTAPMFDAWQKRINAAFARGGFDAWLKEVGNVAGELGEQIEKWAPQFVAWAEQAKGRLTTVLGEVWDGTILPWIERKAEELKREFAEVWLPAFLKWWNSSETQGELTKKMDAFGDFVKDWAGEGGAGNAAVKEAGVSLGTALVNSLQQGSVDAFAQLPQWLQDVLRGKYNIFPQVTPGSGGGGGGAGPAIVPGSMGAPSGGSPIISSSPLYSINTPNVIPNQFGADQELTREQAAAACGPAAAVAFARIYGRNPTLREAVMVAQEAGLWTAAAGMGGPTAEVALLDKMGVPSHQEQGVDWAKVQASVVGGTPVILDTPGHYFAVTGYNAQSGAFNFGASGSVLPGGRAEMTPAQIQALGPSYGNIRTSIYPNAAPSMASVNAEQSSGAVDYHALARAYAVQYGVDPDIYEALIQSESTFNPAALNPTSGARGIAQFMPATGRGVAGQLGLSEEQFYSDPSHQLQGGALYLSQNLERFGGNYQQALTQYKGSPTSSVAQAQAAAVLQAANVLRAQGGTSTGQPGSSLSVGADQIEFLSATMEEQRAALESSYQAAMAEQGAASNPEGVIGGGNDNPFALTSSRLQGAMGGAQTAAMASRQGKAIFDALNAAIDSEGPKTVENLAATLADLRQSLLSDQSLTPEQAQSRFMEVFTQITAAIDDGSPEAIDALKSFMTDFETNLAIDKVVEQTATKANVAIQNASEQITAAYAARDKAVEGLTTQFNQQKQDREAMESEQTWINQYLADTKSYVDGEKEKIKANRETQVSLRQERQETDDLEKKYQDQREELLKKQQASGSASTSFVVGMGGVQTSQHADPSGGLAQQLKDLDTQHNKDMTQLTERQAKRRADHAEDMQWQKDDKAATDALDAVLTNAQTSARTINQDWRDTYQLNVVIPRQVQQLTGDTEKQVGKINEGLGTALDAIRTDGDTAISRLQAMHTIELPAVQSAAGTVMDPAIDDANTWVGIIRQGAALLGSGAASGASGGTSSPAGLDNGFTAMASGGIVTRPTFALIGEHGPEAVVPLGQTGAVHVHLEGAQIYGVGDLDERVRRAVSEGQRRGALAR